MNEPPMTAWEEGYSAYRADPERQACPYLREQHLRAAWLEGWAQAAKDRKNA